MELCITHYISAQYIETTLLYTEMKYSVCSDAKVERVLEAVSGYTNPFSSSFDEYELYFLSFGIPA